MLTRKVSELRGGDVVRLDDGREALIVRVDRMRIFDGDVRFIGWRIDSLVGESVALGDTVVELVREGGGDAVDA